MLVSNYLIHERHTIDTSLIQSRYVYDTFNRYTNDTWPCDRKYGNLVHVRYIDDMETIQKDDTSFSIRLRYWSKVCTIHITIQNTIHFLRKFSIHTRYMNDTKLTKIGSVSRARYTAQHPPKQRFCIECVSKCIEHAFARWIQLWIHVRYGYDTSSIRYDTSYRENAPWFIGKKARHPKDQTYFFKSGPWHPSRCRVPDLSVRYKPETKKKREKNKSDPWHPSRNKSGPWHLSRWQGSDLFLSLVLGIRPGAKDQT